MYIILLKLYQGRGLDAIQNIELSPEIKNVIDDASKTIPIPVVQISRIMEITSIKPEGIEIIKSRLADAEGNKRGASTTITYIGAPRYNVVVNAENFKVAQRFMNNTIEKTRLTSKSSMVHLILCINAQKSLRLSSRYRLRDEAPRKKVSFL